MTHNEHHALTLITVLIGAAIAGVAFGVAWHRRHRNKPRRSRYGLYRAMALIGVTFYTLTCVREAIVDPGWFGVAGAALWVGMMTTLFVITQTEPNHPATAQEIEQ